MSTPQFGPEHIYALSRARTRVIKDSENFSNAHYLYNQKGLPEQAERMLRENRACFEVQAFLRDLITSIKDGGN